MLGWYAQFERPDSDSEGDRSLKEERTRRIAQCCCGACKVAVLGEPEMNLLCHCRNCQLRTGSAFGWSGYFRDAVFTQLSGSYGSYVPSGDGSQERRFCDRCGTTLFWRGAAFPGLVGIAGGCFSDPPLPEPSVAARNETRCTWLTLPGTWRTV
ncbi:MAG: GFA family protein [Rhodospirillales bacterium]